MKKYIISIIAILLIIGCNSKKTETEKDLLESHKNEEKIDSTEVPIQEPIPEKTREQVEDKEQDIFKDDEATLWSSYRSAKAAAIEAEAKGKYEKQAKHLLEAAKYANALQRFDIEAWQYNNAGFALIQDFKEKTNYINLMNKLNSLKLNTEIHQFSKETRELLNNEKEILLEAKDYLAQAKEIDNNLEKSSRTTTIVSNIIFINDVLNFLEFKDAEL